MFSDLSCFSFVQTILFLKDFVLAFQMQFMLLFSRQGKLRLQKWYVAHPDKLKKKITRELITTILARKPKMSSFLEWKDLKVVYKRYVLRPNLEFPGLFICTLLLPRHVTFSYRSWILNGIFIVIC